MSRKGGLGILALLAKLGPKLAPFGKVIISGGKVTKLGLFGASAAAYSSLFGWKVAVMILVMLLLHEGGHLQAMKMRGMKVKGMYFIPFVGAAAVPDDDFPSRESEGFVALAGPTVGLFLCVLTYFAYAITNNVEFVAAIGWIALINLINLLPVMPLDGGRVLRSTTFSISSRSGVILTGMGILIGILVMIKMKIILFLILLPLGLLETLSDYRYERSLKKIKTKTQNALADVLKKIEEEKKNLEASDNLKYTNSEIEMLQQQAKEIEEYILSIKIIPKMSKVQMLVIIVWTIVLAGSLFYMMAYASSITEANFIQLLQ